ncbi:MAG: hypothetical protein HEQ24_24400 [Dolichospermum sp. BR01]|nr:hypothetical protein [Dolichospermum sp. BR01]
MLRPYSCQHLEDKLSVIAKNSSPNASPVQLSVVSCKRIFFSLAPYSLLLASCLLPLAYSSSFI